MNTRKRYKRFEKSLNRNNIKSNNIVIDAILGIVVAVIIVILLCIVWLGVWGVTL